MTVGGPPIWTNLQIFRLVRLGEQDLNEQKVQTFCFVTRLPENEYISSDAMSKLTQKNPSTIRTAELDHGTELYEMDLEIRYDGPLTLLSQHLNKFCQQAERRIYASEKDLKLWTSSIGTCHIALTQTNIDMIMWRII
ncbi:hypothetical protein BLOT_015790 [Blomia tropicalis]|nr:hypothetical protein BLOT_015790 [Blomia tropicalis]